MQSPAPNDFWHRRWLGWISWVFTVSLCLALFGEWQHYRHLFYERNLKFTLWQEWVIIWTLWAKTLVLFFPWLLLAALIARWRWRAGSVVLMLLATLLFGWLVIDMRTVTVTGNHVSTYLAQADLNSLQFAGGAGWMAKYLIAYLGSALVIVCSSCWLVCAIIRHRFYPAPRHSLALGLYGATIVGVVPAWAQIHRPEVLAQMHGEWPLSFAWLGVPQRANVHVGSFAHPFEQALKESLDRIGPRWQSAVHADERVVLPAENRPDVVLVLIESLRADALNPTWMPELDAMSQRGLRCTQHYAGGNCSPMGLFEMIYGRSCLTYNLTLNSHILPQSSVTFHRSGYRTTYLGTLDDIHRMRGKEYLNPRAFDRVSVSRNDDWNEGDRWTIAEARRTLREGHGQPQFLVLFLGSTHHPYASPPEERKFQPVLPEGWSILDADLQSHRAEMENGYANSAAFMDKLLASFVASLDLSHTVVAVAGDHGESFFDDGTVAHSSRLSPVQTRVPMFLIGAGIPAGHIDTMSLNSDILPTVLHAAAGSPVKLAGVSGVDLLDAEARQQRSAVVLSAFQWEEPYNAAVVRAEGRLSFDITIRTGEVKAAGFLNDRGEVDLNLQLSPQEAALWARSLAEQIERLSGQTTNQADSRSATP
jgi:arylsulfatase A-like enzyme